MDQMYKAFRVYITDSQASQLFEAKKDPSRTWMEHFLYLMALLDATASHEQRVLNNIVKFAAPDMMPGIVIRPTRANTKRMSPLEILTGSAPNLRDIVVFGSPCMALRTGKNGKRKAMEKHATNGLIIGKNEETKGYRVYLTKDRVVITTRHVSAIETLGKEANEQILRALENESEDELEELAATRARSAANQRAAQAEAESNKTASSKTKKRKGGEESKSDRTIRRSARERKKSRRLAEADGDDGNGDTSASEPESATESGTEGATAAEPAATTVTRTEGAAATTKKCTGPALMAFAVLSASSETVADGYIKMELPDFTPELRNYREAHRGKDSKLWAVAEQQELESLKANKTWRIVKAPPKAVRLHTKWVYKKKRKSDGTTDKLKARLVVRGDEQKLGVNFVMTFAAVLEMGNARVILILARVWRVPARHGDVPSAYVKAETEEGYDIMLHVPDGMEISQEILDALGATEIGELALYLDRSLYGLKQAGRLWHKHLQKTLLDLGFEQCVTDACIFYLIDENGITVVGTYVDDLLVTDTDTGRVDKFFADMAVLQLKDLGTAEKFLGMRIGYSEKEGYKVGQESTIVKMLARHNLTNASPVRVPIGEEDVPSEGDTALPTSTTGMSDVPTVKQFQSLVGSLLWIARCTRPDIAFAVHRATRRCHALTLNDWKLAKRIARYLSGTKSMKLSIVEDSEPSFPLRLVAYTDADFAGDKDDRKFVSAGVFFVNGMIVGWMCKNQGAVALSTAEAEFVAAAMGGQEVLGLKELFGELEQKVRTPIVLKVDNQAAIKQIENEASSASAKHVDVKLKFLRDYTTKKVVATSYEPTGTMVADLLTKSLPAPRVQELREMIGLQ